MMWLLVTVLLMFPYFNDAESNLYKHWPWVKSPVQYKQKECIDVGSRGQDYRGTMTLTQGGQQCLYWDTVEHLVNEDVLKGIGSHNYCRNPDDSAHPWCWIQRRNRIFRKFCNIPHCQEKPKNHDSQQDTETSCGKRIEEPKKSKIVGGITSSAKAHPWVVSIFKNGVFSCGATLITPCWVLTAAHCFRSGRRTKLEEYTVYLGKNAINESEPGKEQRFNITKLVVHEEFDHLAEDFNHDIALLQIEDSEGKCAQRTSTARTACLPPAQQTRPFGSFCHIAGFGKEMSNSYQYSQYLKEAKVQILSDSVCRSKDYYGPKITENMFCAGSSTWIEDACQGDSGGPLLCEVNGRMFLFGIISWGDGCASKFKPGVYTKVTNYNSWIAKHTGLPSFTKGIMYPQKN